MNLSDLQWVAFRAMSRMNVAKTVSNAYFKSVGADSLPDIDSSIRSERLPEPTKGDVLIPGVQGEGTQMYRYCILAHAFRQRGYNPVIFLCESALPICFRKDLGRDDESICDRCFPYGEHLLELFDLEYVPLKESSLYELDGLPDPEPDSGDYRGIPISRYAEASTRRFLKKYNIDFDDPYEQSIYRRFLETAKILVDATEEIIEKNDIAATVAGDPLYVYGGLFMKVCEKHDITAKSIGMGYYKNQSVILGDQTNRSPLPNYTDDDFVDKYLTRSLDDEERAEVERYMSNRSEGELDGISYTRNTDRGLQPGPGTNIGLFTNLMWDGALEADERTAFSDPFDWVAATIEEFGGRDGANVILKPHPAESYKPTNEGMEEWVRERFPELPENVTVLSPDTDVSPYELMDQLEVGVVWNSTIGLEMAYHGIPTVTTGDAHYKGYGFTYDPKGKSEYLDILTEGFLEMDEQMSKRAERYAHLLFFRKQIEFPFISRDESGVDMLPVSADDLEPGNENIDTIIDSVVSGRPTVSGDIESVIEGSQL